MMQFNYDKEGKEINWGVDIDIFEFIKYLCINIQKKNPYNVFKKENFDKLKQEIKNKLLEFRKIT